MVLLYVSALIRMTTEHSKEPSSLRLLVALPLFDQFSGKQQWAPETHRMVYSP